MPIVGDAKGIYEAYQDPTAINIIAAGVGLVAGWGDAAAKGLKLLSAMSMVARRRCQQQAEKWLGAGYKEIDAGVFPSADDAYLDFARQLASGSRLGLLVVDGNMQDIDRVEYARMKDFLSFYSERYVNKEVVPPEHRPIAMLEAFEKKSLKKAFQGLRMAINDIVEKSFHFDPAKVEKLDSELRSRGMITLSELRRRYSKDYAKIMKRGQIKNETEYYLLRNVLDDPNEKTPEERELLEKLISDYEGA